jgi:hypothetical protein
MAPKYGTAAYLDMVHNLLLFIKYRMGILVRFAVETTDIGHFRVVPVSLYSWLCACLFHRSALLVFIKNVKRAFDFGNPLLNEMKVDQGSL